MLATTMLVALASGAKADILGGVDLTPAGATLLQLSPTVPTGNQVNNIPCLICGAHQPNQPTGFGYNWFGNTGSANTVSFFSTATVPSGPGALGLDQIGTGYSLLPGAPLLTALAGQIGFSVGIDVNDTNTAQTLESFWFINLTQQTVLAVYSPSPLDGTPLPDINDGTGFPDWTLTGFSLAGIDPGDTVAFFARITGANDGPDSFFLVPNTQVVPGPMVGAGLPALLAGVSRFAGFPHMAKASADRLKYQKRWRAAHPDYNKQWRSENMDRVRDLKRKWRSDPVNIEREKQWARARQRKRNA